MISVDGPQVCGAAGERSLADEQTLTNRLRETNLQQDENTGETRGDRQNAADPNSHIVKINNSIL